MCIIVLTKSDLEHINNIAKAMAAYYTLFNKLSDIELSQGRDSLDYKTHLEYLKDVMFECDQRFVDYYPSEEKAQELIKYFSKKYNLEQPKELDKTLISAINLDNDSRRTLFSAILNRLYYRYTNPVPESFDRLDYELKNFNSSRLSAVYQLEKDNYIMTPHLIEESLKLFLSFLEETYSSSNNNDEKQWVLKVKYDLSFTNEKLSRIGLNLKFNFNNLRYKNIDNLVLVRNVSIDNLSEIKNNFGKNIISDCIYKLWAISPEKFKDKKESASYKLYLDWFKTGITLIDSDAIREVKRSVNDFNRTAKGSGCVLSKKVTKDIHHIIDNVPQYKKKLLI